MFITEVDKHNGQNGIIKTEAYDIDLDHINLGPIKQSAENCLVKFEYIGGIWGKCLTEKFISKDYHPYNGNYNTPPIPPEESIEDSGSSNNTVSGQKPSEQSFEPLSAGSIVYHAEPGKAKCIHARKNCSGLDNIQGELNSKVVKKEGKIPEEVSHLRKCSWCIRK